ncbi:hypothetical protein SOHN41_00371 [Shewanella sp. HN-41]|nr:hypothetical protein SOHN41_00371 [Shewanella sp. HN-41]
MAPKAKVLWVINLRRETLRQKDRGEDDCTVPVVCRRGLFLPLLEMAHLCIY